MSQKVAGSARRCICYRGEMLSLFLTFLVFAQAGTAAPPPEPLFELQQASRILGAPFRWWTSIARRRQTKKLGCWTRPVCRGLPNTIRRSSAIMSIRLTTRTIPRSIFWYSSPSPATQSVCKCSWWRQTADPIRFGRLRDPDWSMGPPKFFRLQLQQSSQQQADCLITRLALFRCAATFRARGSMSGFAVKLTLSVAGLANAMTMIPPSQPDDW